MRCEGWTMNGYCDGGLLIFLAEIFGNLKKYINICKSDSTDSLNTGLAGFCQPSVLYNWRTLSPSKIHTLDMVAPSRSLLCILRII